MIRLPAKQTRVVELLRSVGGGPLTYREISEALHIHMSTPHRMLPSLEASGLVQATESRGSHALALTDEGIVSGVVDGVYVLAGESPVSEHVEMSAPARAFRRQYEAAWRFCASLLTGGIHDLDNLKRMAALSDPQWDALLVRLHQRAALVTFGSSKVNIIAKELRVAQGSEADFCELFALDDAHALHMNVLLRKSKAFDAAMAVRALYGQFGIDTLAERTGRSLTDLRLLMRAHNLGAECLQEMSQRGVSVTYVPLLEDVRDPEERRMLVIRISDEGLNRSDVREIIAGEEPAAPEPPQVDEPDLDKLDKLDKLDMLLLVVQQLAAHMEDLGEIRHRVAYIYEALMKPSATTESHDK